MKTYPLALVTYLVAALFAAPLFANDDAYKLGPDSQRQDGVPQGKVTKHLHKSEVFPAPFANTLCMSPHNTTVKILRR
jgi:hypothetical protein